jgi:hypothetical protein
MGHKNSIDLRTLDRLRDAAVTSLIPSLSCLFRASSGNLATFAVIRRAPRRG